MSRGIYDHLFEKNTPFYANNPHQKHARVNMNKRLSKGNVRDSPDQAEEKPTAQELWEHDSFYKDTKSLLVLFQIMGVMPIERSTIGSTTWKWFSKTTIYAYILFIAETVYVTIVFMDRMDITLQKGKRFDEYIYNFIFLSILVPHFLLPLAAWKNGPEVAIYKNMWTNIQFKYYKVTGKTIKFSKLECITWSLCVFSWLLSVAVMLAQYYLQPDLLFWHTLAYYHILAMMDCLCSLWFINCRAQGEAAKGLTKSLQRALESHDSSVQLAKCRNLWVDLSHLMQQLGRAYSGMYGMFCILILLTTIVASYGFLSEIFDHGFSFKEIGFLLIASYTMGILYVICNEAYFASKKMGADIQERLLNVNFAGLDSHSKMEVQLFLTAIEKNPPTMNLNGFVDVNRRLITGVVSSMGTYLVMLMQFKLSLSRTSHPKVNSALNHSSSILNSTF